MLLDLTGRLLGQLSGVLNSNGRGMGNLASVERRGYAEEPIRDWPFCTGYRVMVKDKSATLYKPSQIGTITIDVH